MDRRRSDSSLSASSSTSLGAGATYEATKAAERTRYQPDPIHWHGASAFRDGSYRQLHHQHGRVGTFHIRLLEAANLQRSYWSALALGPVKHLGLSKAHGAVSSFCTFRLEFAEFADVADGSSNKENSRRHFLHSLGEDRKPAAAVSGKRGSNNKNKKRPAVVSPVVPNDNNPVWDSCQFEFPLKKGAMPHDGMRVLLHVQVEEDATALDNFMPLTGGNRLIGVGSLDLTELCLGETVTGQPLPGVRDAWVDIALPPEIDSEQQQLQHELLFHSYGKDDPLAPPPVSKNSNNSNNNNDEPKLTGMVRVLVSYDPFGLEPQPKDVVALEAFARRHPGHSSCRPVLEPLSPLAVLERRGSYALCEYLLAGGGGGPNRDRDHSKVCVRLHRNALFVIERQNLLDAAHNLALLPVDVVMSTPVGRACHRALGPVAHAGGQLVMPLALSVKLLWMAARTTGLGVVSGVQALGTTVWQEGAASLTGGREHHHDDHGMYHSGSSSSVTSSSSGGGVAASRNRHGDSRRAATAKFVQL